VVNQLYQVVNQVDNVVNQVDPNNTQITIPREQENVAAPTPYPSLKESRERLPVKQVSGEETPEDRGGSAHARALSQEANAGEKTPEIGGIRPFKKSIKAAGEKTERPLEAEELAAELESEYRSIEGVTPARGDRAFISSLLAEYGYAHVLEGIEELRRALSAEEIKKPLLYLKAICRRISAAPSGPPKRGAPREKIIGHDEKYRRKRKEFLKTLYCN
jgi:hypothetical protein